MPPRFFFDAPDEKDDSDDRNHDESHGEDRRCTPEKLEAFIRKHLDLFNRFPTLGEIKREFGGILSAYVCSWELMDRGIWQQLQRLRKPTSRKR